MNKITRFIASAAFLAVGLVASPVVAAPLSVTANPIAVVGAPGQTVQVELFFANPSSYSIENMSINLMSPDPSTADLGEFDEPSFYVSYDGSPIAPNSSLTAYIDFRFFTTAPVGPDFESHSIVFGYDAIDLLGGNDLTAQEATATIRARAVPEPASMALFGLALAGAAIARRRRA